MGEALAGPVMNRVLHTRPVISRVQQRLVGNRVSDFGFTGPVMSRVLAETSEKPRLRLWVYRTGD